MKMSIKFDGNEVILSSIDPTSDTLIFTASKDSVSFDTLKVLEEYKGVIEYYEDDVLIVGYKNYTENFDCRYIASTYTVKLSKISQQDIDIKDLKNKNSESTMFLDSALCEISILITMILGGV